MTKIDHPFEVGQRVLIDSYSRRGERPYEGVVTKVGTKFLHVESLSLTFHFSLETRYIKDDHSREWVLTPEEFAEREHRAGVVKTLALHGISPAKPGGFQQSTEVLEQIVALLESELDAAELSR